MGNKTFFISLFILMVITGCTKSVKYPETPVLKEPEPEQPAEPEVKLDYDQISLEIVHIQQLDEQAGPFNTYNPKFSFDESYIAVEVNLDTFNKIYIYRINSGELPDDFAFRIQKIQEVYLTESHDEKIIEDFFRSSFQESFNYEFNWFPASSSYLFTSNAGIGEYNIFIGSVEPEDITLKAIQQSIHPKSFGDYLMMTEEVKKDGQASVSPDGTKIAFTSGRTGNGDLYLLNLVTGDLKRLTYSEDTDFFPRWSPDSRDIVYTTGGKHAHDIHIIRNAGKTNEYNEVLIKWFFDDVLPAYSPDGEKISFYTTYNKERDPFNTKRWALMIIPSDGSAPQAGKELIKYFHVPDVVKDNTQGTAWFPDSTHIILAKNIDRDYNPIYIYNTETRQESLVETGTNINHDISVSSNGLISFRAQVLGWDRIFIAVSTYFQEYRREKYQN